MTDVTTHRIRTGLRDGLLAGAVGTTVLNAVTYADMAVSGRNASSMPADTVDEIADRLGAPIGGSPHAAANRSTALGALSGTVAGLGVGALFGLARRVGIRLPPGLGAVVAAATAMAATDLPAAALGVTDLRRWSTENWVSDIAPHLAFGVATHSTLRLLDPPPPPGLTVVVARPAPAPARLLARCALLGFAVGGRSSLAALGPALTGRSGPAKLAAVAALSGELVMDKLPSTPSRLSPAGQPPRILGGAGAAVALARRSSSRAALPAIAGALGTLAGSVAGVSWRSWATSKAGLNLPDWQAAVLEDIYSTAVAVLACSESGL